MDEKQIHKTVMQKLSKRSRLLRHSIKPEKLKIYSLKKTQSKGRRSNLRTDRRRPTYPIDSDYIECINCDPITGIKAYKPFYKVDYLNDFYYQLEAMYYANRTNNLIMTDYGTHSVFFENLNLYQTIDYCYIASPTLGVYLFRYLVDMVYILKVPKDRVNDFYLKSRIIIVRYTSKPVIKNQFDNLLKLSDGPVVITPVGVDVNIYDLIPIQFGGRPTPQTYTDPLRVFSKNGSILFVTDAAKDTWTFNLPADSIAPDTVKYEMILYPNW